MEWTIRVMDGGYITKRLLVNPNDGTVGYEEKLFTDFEKMIEFIRENTNK